MAHVFLKEPSDGAATAGRGERAQQHGWRSAGSKVKRGSVKKWKNGSISKRDIKSIILARKDHTQLIMKMVEVKSITFH